MLPRYLTLKLLPFICMLILKYELPETPEIDPSVLMDVLFAKEFVVFERKDDGTLVPVSAFHPEINAKTGKPLDYTDRQMRYTLLKNTRREISEDKYTEVFRHLNYKE